MELVFKALADSGRRKLLDALDSRNGQTLNQLCRHLDMSRQAVSKHLSILLEARLVVALWNGREKRHYLNPVPIRNIAHEWMAKYERRIPQAFAELERALELTK